MSTFQSGESIYNLVPPLAAQGQAPASHLATRPTEAMRRAVRGAPPSYGTLGLQNSTRRVANASGMEPDLDCIGGGTHQVKASFRTMGRFTKPEVDPGTFLRRGTGNPASDTVRTGARAAAAAEFAASARDGGFAYAEDGDGAYGQADGEYGGLGGSMGISGRGQGMSGRGAPAGSQYGASGTFIRRHVTEPKPAVTTVGDEPLHGLRTDKDFVTSNALDAAMQATRRKPTAATRAVDREGFGKVPSYLARLKESAERDREIEFAAAREHEAALRASASAAAGLGGGNPAMAGRGGAFVMPAEERERVVADLKAKWAERNRQYQQLSFRLDTRSKIQRKEELERELERLEAYITRLSKEKVIIRP